MSEKEMLRRAQRGDEESLNDIAERFYDDIYRYCAYMTGNRTDSYDLTQETFLRLIRSIANYKEGNLKGYLYMIARNICMDYFRCNKRRMEREVPWEEGGGQDRAALEGDFREVISFEELVGELPDMQREAIILYYVTGFKYREIGKITGVSASTVKSRIRQGLEKLRRQKEKEVGHEKGINL